MYGSKVLNSPANLSRLLYLDQSFTKEMQHMSLGALTTQVNTISPPLKKKKKGKENKRQLLVSLNSYKLE